LARAASRRPERLHGVGERAGDRVGDDAPLQGLRPTRGAPVAERALRQGAGRLRRVGRALLTAGEPRLHRAVEPSVADGIRDQESGKEGLMKSRHSVIGWIVWQIGVRVIRRKIAQNRVKINAAATIALVLVGGVLAARGT